jgi:hypothetical protein
MLPTPRAGRKPSPGLLERVDLAWHRTRGRRLSTEPPQPMVPHR